jgi:signal transduction histidine kinase
MRLFQTLSGRFLILTVIFVMIAEVLIFVPSVARFRLNYLQERLNLSQVASLTLLASKDDMVDPELEAELLRNAEVLNIVLRRNETRELVLASPMPEPVDETFDLSEAGITALIADAMRTLVRGDNRVIRVIGVPVKGGGVEIEATLKEKPLRDAMVAYGRTIIWLSLFISAVTASLLFLAVRRLMVHPIKRVVANMMRYQDDPEDAQRIITPRSRVVELRQAEEALADMESRLTRSLRQKDRLAALGGAVARVSHDLRGMLTTAQLLADRIEMSKDPAIARTAPKLVGSISRAINLCEQTLTYGRADEPAPVFADFALRPLVDEVLDNDRLQATAGEGGAEVDFSADVPPGLTLHADREQLFRVLANLVRNARQAIAASAMPGSLCITARTGQQAVVLDVEDTGPGLPRQALDKLFRPFEGRARQGGTGLGLAIAAELVKGHGGRLELVRTGETGTLFRITLPQRGEEAA